MDVPSPRFSSAMGEEIGEDEEINEIISCIIHNDSQALQDLLTVSKLNITQIRDELGYTLMHLAVYNNSEKCVEVLIRYVLTHVNRGGPKSTVSRDFADHSDYDIIQAMTKRALLKDWIN